MILEYFEDSEEETWTRSTRNKVVIFCVLQDHIALVCVLLLCTHAVPQCVLQSVHQVVVMWVEELLDHLAAEHAPLVDIDQLSDLQPANRVLRRQEQHNDTLRIIRYQTIVIHPWQRGEDVTGWLKLLHLYTFSCTRRSHLLLHWSCNPVFISHKHWIFTSCDFSEFQQHHGLSVHLTKFHITTCCTVTFPHICMWKLTHETLWGKNTSLILSKKMLNWTGMSPARCVCVCVRQSRWSADVIVSVWT